MRSANRSTGVASLHALVPSDHVCWSVGPADDYDGLAKACLAAGSEAGDKVVYFGPERALPVAPVPAPDVPTHDPRVSFLGGGPLDPDAMLAMFRREAAAAEREGFRALRVVADMDWVTGLATHDELTAFELRLDATVDELGAIVVCAYRNGTYAARQVAQVNTVHPAAFGELTEDLGFRVWSGGSAQWHVAGEVDCFNADAFAFTLASAAAASRSPVRVRLDGLQFIDVAGMRAIATTATAGGAVRICLERPSETFARCWRLLGFEELAPSVELVR